MKFSRRKFLQSAAVIAVAGSGCNYLPSSRGRLVVNDVQSRLNETEVSQIVRIQSPEAAAQAIRRAAEEGRFICLSGGRHAMGSQQFLTKSLLLDTAEMNRVVSFDRERGVVEVEAGIQWPDLLKYLLRQKTDGVQWTFAQKQTGANRFCIGGAVSSNIHSRGLTMKPFISDIESVTLIDAKGVFRECGRTVNSELLRLAVGGYGLFGLVYSVKLKLVPRLKVRRVVETSDVEHLGL